MVRSLKFVVVIFAASSVLAIAENAAAPAKLSAVEIVDRSVTAQGGAQAWRAIDTMTMAGKMEAGGNNRPGVAIPGAKGSPAPTSVRSADQALLPFVMDLKRPKKQRIELEFHGQKAVQVFDGTEGWKLRPFLNRREVEAYTADQLQSASMQSELDGPLVDYVAKGTQVELVAVEQIEKRNTYRLKLTLRSGRTKNIWIDSETFLPTRIEGNPRRLDGRAHPVEVYYSDYRTVGAVKVPFTIETRVLEGPTVRGVHNMATSSEKILLEKVSANSKLSDVLFTKADLVRATSAPSTARPVKLPLP